MALTALGGAARPAAPAAAMPNALDPSNLVVHGFDGPVYPVNPKASAIHSIRAGPTIAR